MRIAMLHKTLPFSRITAGGGVDYQVHYLANALVDRGHEVTVFSADARPEGALYEVEEVRPPRVVQRSRILFHYFFGLAFRRCAFRGFDVVHAHGDDAFVGRRRPWVRTFYGTSLDEALSATTWKRRIGCLPHVAFETLSAAKAHVSVGISDTTLSRLPFVDRKIPCGVDLSAFRPGGRRSERPTILFLGDLDGRKRGRQLVEMFVREIRPRLPEAELWMVCYEEGFEAPSVRWFSRLSTEELVRLYREAWVFCLPSEYEGFGVPYVEALACGTPVVGTPNPGAREVLRDGRDGVLVGLEGLGEALVELLGDEARRGELSRLGPERAGEFSLGSVAARYEEAYREARERSCGA